MSNIIKSYSTLTKPLEKTGAADWLKESSAGKDLLQMIFIGLLTEIIYITYIVAFPLISNTQAGGPAADLEILMRDYRWFAPIYTVGILLLYYLFWKIMQIVFRLSAAQAASQKDNLDQPARAASATLFNQPKLLILAFGLLFGFTLTWFYPITANDLFRYVLRGRIWAVYGESPMLHPPNDFPNDPYIAFAGEFGDWVSGYGPLWEIIIQVPLRLVSAEMVPGSVSLKLLVLLCYLLCAILLGWFAVPQHASPLAALTFFAWNPLILIQVSGNGHNDMVFMVLMVLGIIMWQRQNWWGATLALTLAALAKASAFLIIPLFAVVLLRNEVSWGKRLTKALSAGLIGLITTYLVYSTLGPVTETLRGVTDMLTERRGFALASEVRMILREVLPRNAETAIAPESIRAVQSLRELLPCSAAEGEAWMVRLANLVIPCNVAEALPRTIGRNLFILFYLWLLIQLWRRKLDLITAGFLAYFSQLMLGRTFRIWYPIWLIPLAALHLTSATFWRTFLFSLTSELSIINYFVVWRWWLRFVPWERLGLLTEAYYWPVMHTLTVPWLFGIPLFGPILMRWASKRSQSDEDVQKVRDM